MSVCPWCQAEVTEPRFPCRQCGKRPKDHVSYARLAAVQAPPPPPPPEVVEVALELEEMQEAPFPEPSLDIPDLMTAPRHAAPAPAPVRASSPDLAAHDASKPPSLAPPPPPKPKPAKAGLPAMGSSFNDGLEGMEAGGASLDLAAPEWERSSGAAPAPAASAPAVPAVKPVSTIMESEDGGKAAAEQLGAYGPAPSELWKAPVYAYRVKIRQMELRNELATRRADLAKAQSQTDDALVVLAERGRKAVDSKDAYSKLVGAVVLAEATLRDRDSALASETEAHRKQTAVLDTQIAQYEAELAGARAEEKAYQASFDKADGIRQRADAKVKRVEIDLRSSVARASAGPGGGAGASADPDVVTRTAERGARLDELERAMPAVTEATAQLAAARRKVSEAQNKMLGVKNARAALEDKFNKRGAAHGAEVQRAQLEVRTSLATLGRVMAEDYATFGAEWAEARKELAALDTVTAGRDDAVVLHTLALDANDGETVKKGLGIAAAVVVLLGLLLTLPVVMSALSSKPPPPHPPATVPLDE